MADDGGCAAAFFSSPEGARAAEQLAAALASQPAATGALVEEVRLTSDGCGMALRQVHADGGRVAAALRTTAPPFAPNDALKAAELVLLTHTFQLPSHAGALTLKTLAALKPDRVGVPVPSTDATMRAVFGNAALLVRGGFATALAVDGRFLLSTGTPEHGLASQPQLAGRGARGGRRV